jgi:hypothetical protein
MHETIVTFRRSMEEGKNPEMKIVIVGMRSFVATQLSSRSLQNG